jgi:nicotinamidase-related amidase
LLLDCKLLTGRVGESQSCSTSVWEMAKAALLLIDLQLDYFPGGAFPLVDPVAAVEVAAEVLAACRVAGLPVVHVQHIWDDPEAEFMKPGTAGIQVHPSVAPSDSEAVVTKEFPNAFRETDLKGVLEGLGVESLIVAGMMTSMCVDATVRAAVDLGYAVTVAADGCASPELEFDGVEVSGPQVQAAFLAMLADSYATVRPGAEVIASLQSLELDAAG